MLADSVLARAPHRGQCGDAAKVAAHPFADAPGGGERDAAGSPRVASEPDSACTVNSLAGRCA